MYVCDIIITLIYYDFRIIFKMLGAQNLIIFIFLSIGTCHQNQRVVPGVNPSTYQQQGVQHHPPPPPQQQQQFQPQQQQQFQPQQQQQQFQPQQQQQQQFQPQQQQQFQPQQQQQQQFQPQQQGGHNHGGQPKVLHKDISHEKE